MQEELLNGKISTALIRYTIPIVLTMIATQLYSIVDGMMVGSALGSQALAAVSNASSILMIFLFISGGLELGANLLIASLKQKLSHKDFVTTIYTLLAVDVLISISLMLLGQCFLTFMITLLHTPESIISMVKTYARIYLCGLPFLMSYDIMKQILIGYGDSKKPLYLVLLTTGVNIVLDALLIYVIPLGIAGAGIATVCSQIIGATLCFKIVYSTLIQEKMSLHPIDLKIVKQWLHLSFLMICQQMTAPITSMVKQRLLGDIGVQAIAGFSAANSLLSFMIMPIAGCAQALTVFTAQNISAHQEKRAKKALQIARLLSCGITTILILICLIFHTSLLSLYTNDQETLFYGMILLTHEPFFYYFYSLRNMYESRLRGFTMMKEYLISTLSTTTVILLSCVFLVTTIGFSGFYLATGMGNLVGCLLSIQFERKIISSSNVETVYDGSVL